MEKIYMDSRDKKPKKQSFLKKIFNDKGSITAFVVIALVGVVGLMVFGFNQISYAADPVNGYLPDTFVSDQGDLDSRLIGETIDGVDGILPILGFYTDKGVPFFCTEYDISYVTGQTYTKGQEITDQGLIYLMSQLYPNKVFKDSNGNQLSENIQIWLTQSAVWTYLHEVKAANNTLFNSTPTNAPKKYYDNIRKVNSLYSQGTGDVQYVLKETRPLYELYGINGIIAQAIAYRTTPYTSLNITKNSDTISITNDNKFYQTDLVSVVGSTSSPIINKFEGYSVDLSRAPQGTILVDESGNVYDDVSNMAPTSKFYVRIPIDKVTDENKSVKISILGNFKMYGANEYVSNSYQKVVHVSLLNKSLSRPLDIELDYTPDVPDTGMGVAQTIYFIGLILLLSGVGIVYANAKPKTSE